MWLRIISAGISSFLQLVVVNSFFQLLGKRKKVTIWLRLGADIIMVFAFGLFFYFSSEVRIAATIGVSAIIFIYSFFFRIGWVKRIFGALVLFILLALSEALAGTIFSAIYRMSVAQIQANGILQMVASVASNLLLFLIIKIVRNFIKNKDGKISWKVLTALMILPITTFVILYELSDFIYMQEEQGKKVVAGIGVLLLIICNVVVFYIFDYINEQKDRENRLQTQSQMLALEKQFYEKLVGEQIASNKALHDLKNELFAIKSLMREDAGAAKEEIERICKITEQTRSRRVTGNEAVDALLFSKCDTAEKRSITIKIVSFISDLGKYNPIDLCVILGNLLDNAIEASEKLSGDREIECTLRQHGEMLSITVRNRTELREVPEQTTKKDKLLHGYGLKNVEEIVRKNAGIIRLGIREGYFIANIIL